MVCCFHYDIRRKNGGNHMKRKLREWMPSTMVLLCAALVFFLLSSWAAPEREEASVTGEPAHYERCKVVQILADSTTQSEVDDGGWRGDQLMLVEVLTGIHAGETLQVYNYVGPLYGGPLKQGDTAVVTISTYNDGSYNGTIFEFDRLVPLAIVMACFCWQRCWWAARPAPRAWWACW